MKKKFGRLRIKNNLPLNRILLIYTGPLIDRKDQETAIKGVLNSKYKDKIFLVLCGDGQNYDKLTNKYKNEKNILFTGKIKNISEFLRASDIYISTSKSEGMPNSVLEAMATGLPVVLSSIPQHIELLDVNKKIGEIYKIGDIVDLTRKIDSIIETNYKEIGKNNKKVANKYLSAEAMSENYQRLYEKIFWDRK